jgi:DNA repair protein RecO (recombination protein O)
MAYQKTRIISLRLTDYSESSQVVAAFSRDFGRLSLLAKGSKRKSTRSHPAGAIDLFQLLDVVFLEKQGSALSILTEYELAEGFLGLRKSLDRGYAALFMAELILSLTEEHDPSPGVFDLAKDTLSALCTEKRPNVVLNAFEIRFLDLIGYAPVLDRCASCGGELGDAARVAFAALSGGAVCKRCETSARERVYVSRGALAVLHKLAASPSIRVARLRIDGRIAADVRSLLSHLWRHQMGREPVMLKYLR